MNRLNPARERRKSVAPLNGISLFLGCTGTTDVDRGLHCVKYDLHEGGHGPSGIAPRRHFGDIEPL